MYPIAEYRENNQDNIEQLIDTYPLATVTFVNNKGDIEVCHIPLILNKQKTALLGHMVANNPLAKQLANRATKVTCIFHGPDAYVSPNDAPEVSLPTWHYAKVEIKGSASVIPEPKQKLVVMASSVDHFERELNQLWRLKQAEPDYVEQLFKYICVFSIEIVETLASFKLSQNKSKQTRLAVKHSLLQRGLAKDAEIIPL